MTICDNDCDEGDDGYDDDHGDGHYDDYGGGGTHYDAGGNDVGMIAAKATMVIMTMMMTMMITMIISKQRNRGNINSRVLCQSL